MDRVRQIYLIGYMGCGKTTVGIELAKLLGYRFIDLDQQIEMHENCTIAEIFAKRGEEFFRNIESIVLQEIAKINENCVVATGGGVPCNDNNMALMNLRGITIFLRASLQTLLKRLANDRQRPLINKLSINQLPDFITQSLNKRTPFYNRAQLIIDVDGRTEKEISNLLRNVVWH